MRSARPLVMAGIVVVASLLGGAPRPAGAVQFSISGVVTDAGGVGIQNVLVYLYEGGSGATCCTPVTGGTTASTGAYSFFVDAGTYRARFYPPAGYIEEWFNDASDFGSAIDLDLTSSNATGIDAVLAQGVGVSGTVTAAGGGALAGIGVHAFDATQPCCTWVTGAQTDASGAYNITLANGTYRLLFYVESGSHLSEWFDSAADFDAATDLVVAGTALTGKDAQLVTGQTISGTVTSSTNAPLADVFVGAFKNTTCCEWVAGTQTDASGNYTLAVADGTYRLMFYPTSGNALMEWWDNAADFDAATPITISGASQSGKNAQLATGLTVSGTVTGTGGTPLENVFVGAFRASGQCCDWVNGTGTDSLGKYSFTVPTGAYRIMFHPYDGTHLGEWWNNAGNFETATDVVVNADVVGINAALVTGTKITGTVTAANTTPIANVFVGAFDANAACCTWIAGTGTDSLGQYELVVPPNASYKLMFYPYEGTFLMEWWDNAADFDAATAVAVGTSDVPGKNAALTTGLQISGTVSADGGGALEGVGVIAFVASSGDWVGGSMTAADGTYSITVPDGSYKLMFQGPPGYLTEFHNNKAGMGTADAVTMGNASQIVNASLAPGRLLSGTVTSSGGGALSNAFVNLWTGGTTDCTTHPTFVAGTATDGLGNYTFTVAPATYRIQFGHETHATEWWNDKASCAAANPVTVGTVDVPDIDAVLAATFPVSGTVTVAGGGALGGASVLVESGGCDAAVIAAFEETATDGTYTLRLPNGTYRVFFAKNGYQAEYWNDKSHCAAATTITVAGAATTGINAALAQLFPVSGTVTSSNGSAIANMPVELYAASGNATTDCQAANSVGITTTAANGTYTATVPAGSYRIVFFGDVVGHQREYWDNVIDCTASTAVPVAAAVTGKDATLAVTFAVSGTLLASDTGTGLGGALVIFDASTSDCASPVQINRTTTPSNGTWTVPVPNGTYRVHFVPPAGYTHEYYNDRTTCALADTVTVNGANITNINATLAAAP